MISSQDLNYIIITIAAFFLSAFFSSSETIFSTANKLKIKMRVKGGSSSAKTAEKLLRKPENFLTPILVGNNIANILYSTAIGFFCINTSIAFLHQLSPFAQVIYQTIILLLFAEVIPKIFARQNADEVISIWIYPFIFLEVILKPLSLTFTGISRLILKLIGRPITDDDEGLFSRFEIEDLLEEAVKKDKKFKGSVRVINKIMDLKNTKVKEIMTPRNELFSLEKEASLYELKKLIKETSYSKIPVYEEHVDRIIGVVYAHDLIYKPEKCTQIIKEVIYVPANKSVYGLFNLLKKTKSSIAVIFDEFGGSLGIVTMHDIWENMLGRLGDYDDRSKKTRGLIYREDKKQIIAKSNVDLEDFNSFLENIIKNDKYNLPDKTFDTLNGFIIDRLKRIPLTGEHFTYKELRFKIMKAVKNKTEMITLQLPDKIY